MRARSTKDHGRVKGPVGIRRGRWTPLPRLPRERRRMRRGGEAHAKARSSWGHDGPTHHGQVTRCFWQFLSSLRPSLIIPPTCSLPPPLSTLRRDLRCVPCRGSPTTRLPFNLFSASYSPFSCRTPFCRGARLLPWISSGYHSPFPLSYSILTALSSFSLSSLLRSSPPFDTNFSRLAASCSYVFSTGEAYVRFLCVRFTGRRVEFDKCLMINVRVHVRFRGKIVDLKYFFLYQIRKLQPPLLLVSRVSHPYSEFQVILVAFGCLCFRFWSFFSAPAVATPPTPLSSPLAALGRRPFSFSPLYLSPPDGNLYLCQRRVTAAVAVARTRGRPCTFSSARFDVCTWSQARANTRLVRPSGRIGALLWIRYASPFRSVPRIRASPNGAPMHPFRRPMQRELRKTATGVACETIGYLKTSQRIWCNTFESFDHGLPFFHLERK